jgi:hypothetical protein
MSKVVEDSFYGQGSECQFEPHAIPILCVDCDKPTGEEGTCTDRGICATCREEYQRAGLGDADIAEMVIGVVSGEYYYKPTKRVLHFAGDNGKPICRKFENAQPVTTNAGVVSCKRCKAANQAA